MDFNFKVITEDAFYANLLKDFSNISFRTKKKRKAMTDTCLKTVLTYLCFSQKNPCGGW